MNYIVTNRPEYLKETLQVAKPDYVFFPFWSWKVPKDITDNYRCIGFHTGELPEHKGGSPIQNLIRLGVKKTSLNAILINDKIDGGRVVLRREIVLEGTLEEILLRMSDTIGEMINDIQKNNR